MKIKVGILGYGNLGRGVESAIKNTNDMVLKYVFTRRDKNSVKILTKDAEVLNVKDILDKKDEIDVLIICGGSATDLPVQTPMYAKYFNVVDSFDTHANIPLHFENVDKASKEGNNVGIISIGWDPGLFSLARLYGSAVLPIGDNYTFWGRGVSQGHSDAIRRIDGVKDARQYTVPIDAALKKVREGEKVDLTTREKHLRECYVVVEDNADKKRIEKEIKEMPNYFADYDTYVHFISEEELKKNHSGIPHGGVVIRTGKTGENNEHKSKIEFSLSLESNPEFTSSVLVSYARAGVRLKKMGEKGCKTAFDIPPYLLSEKDYKELIKEML